MELFPNITDFSHELLCQILKYLPLREILSVAMLCKKMATAVDMHLRLCKSIDFCQDAICGYMPSTITDDHLLILLKKCPHLETVYGLHPVKIERRRLRKRSALTIPGIIEALSLCFHLKAIETSDLRLFEAIMQHLPHIEIIGHFQNRDGLFPPQASQRLKLQPYPRISSLHLIGVEVPELTAMPHLQHLHLQCVRFTKLQPFRAFLAQNLKSFVMKHCIGPSVPQRYLSLIIALSSSPNLNHLELVRVPLLNGLFQRAVEDSYRHNGFVNLRTLVISGCKGVLEADLGHLMIVSSKNLETLYIQPSLTKDSLFVSLSYAQCVFPRLQNLHLGYIDTLNSSGEWSNDALLSLGLAEVPDTPSSITDSGMKVISELFPHIKTMSVSNCPHLMIMYHWMSADDNQAWSRLTDLTLQKCHCLQLSSFAVFISFLSNVEVVILNDMFREPPKGCSHVGLSAGTGLGMSSAVVSNQDEHIAVQGHHQDFEHPGDEENEENEMMNEVIIDVENEEPHFMVLQRDFFDGEEEEEDDDGADAVLDDQDPPVVLEQQNIEEHSNTKDCVADNSPQINKKALVNENKFSNVEPSSSSVEDKTLYSPSSIVSSDIKNVHKADYHMYPSKSSLPSMKSVHVQCDTLPEECHQSSNSDTLKKNSFHNNDMSDDSYKSDDDIKICVCSKLSDYNYDADYDPHKPSTSKAGSHLDYCAPCDGKPFKTSDSETDHFDNLEKDTKKSKEPLEQKIVKTEFLNPNTDELSARTNMSLKLSTNGHPSETENSTISGIPDNSLVSQDHFGICNSSLGEKCKPCVVLVNRLDYSKNYTLNSKVIRDHERNSFQTEVPTLISYNSSENENKFFSESDVKKCWLTDDDKHSNFVSESIEMSSNNPTFNNFLKNDDEILAQNIENSEREVNSLNNDESKDMICDCFEKLDNVNSNEVLKSSVKSVKLNENTLQVDGDTPEICSSYFLAENYKDSLNNNPRESEEIVKKYENLSHENTSIKENYVLMETEDLNDTVVKIESGSSHCYGNGNNVSNKNEESNILNMNAVQCNPQSSSEAPVCCSGICEQFVPYEEKASETKDACTTSLNKKPELSFEREGSYKFQPGKDVLSVDAAKILGDKTRIFNNNDDILSKNFGSVQENVNEINTKEKEIADFNGLCQDSKMQNEELYGTRRKCFDNIYKSDYYRNSAIKKQNANPVVPSFETDLIADDMKNSVCNIDESSGALDLSTSNKTYSKESNMYDTYQPSTSRDGYNNGENSMKSTRSLKRANSVNHTSNEASSLQTRKYTNSYSNITIEKEPEHNISRLKGVKRNSKDEKRTYENSEAESEVSKPVAKRLRSYEEHDTDSSNYYVLVSDTTTDIVNSVTGESHRLPTCSVLLTRPNNKCNTFEKMQKSSSTRMNCSPRLSSDDGDKNQCESFTETCKLQVGVNCSQKCANYRQVRKTYSMRKKGRQKYSGKVEDGTKCCKEGFEKVCECSKRSSCKHSNICDHQSCSSSSLKVRKEKLKIAYSDAAVIIRNQAHKKSKSNLPVDSKNSVGNNDVNASGNSKFSNPSVMRKESERVTSNSSKKYSDVYHNNFKSKNNRSGSAEINITHNGKRTRKKRIPLSQKQGKRLSKNSVGKSEHLNKHTRNSSKKIPTVPTVCLISQGTQANSADIRRSVRRIRRATAQARRTMSPMRVSRNSTHSNKISAKILNKKPVNMNPRPEMLDKATSTSDPLLEDDAVQTLQLTSKTLLSFTVVSCGISDIIIDHCPKLFHIEVQACRILKKFHLNYCPAMKRLNVSQCPKLSICALASPVIAIEPDSYILVSYEPCMQGYHPGEGEKAILSRATLDQSVLICHDISAISHEGFQAMFKEKLIEWFRYLAKVHAVLKPKSKNPIKKLEEPENPEYPWSHDLRRIHGNYAYLPSTDFCHSDGRYQLVTNNPVFCDVFETHQQDTGFPAISDCDAHRNISLISHEAREKAVKMDSKFIGFYIPVTENNQINF